MLGLGLRLTLRLGLAKVEVLLNKIGFYIGIILIIL
jgi:hypothetical protein